LNGTGSQAKRFSLTINHQLFLLTVFTMQCATTDSEYGDSDFFKD